MPKVSFLLPLVRAPKLKKKTILVSGTQAVVIRVGISFRTTNERLIFMRLFLGQVSRLHTHVTHSYAQVKMFATKSRGAIDFDIYPTIR